MQQFFNCDDRIARNISFVKGLCHIYNKVWDRTCLRVVFSGQLKSRKSGIKLYSKIQQILQSSFSCLIN